MNNTPILLDPTNFVEKMARYWTETLGNASSEALQLAWRDLACSFGRQIISHDNPDTGTRWEILQLPTGAGKSQGTILYCAMLAAYGYADHPGVLIVTRLKADADKMADSINRLAGQQGYAYSYHSNKADEEIVDRLCFYPVLVITHSAYELALRRLADKAILKQKWPQFYAWQATGRMLVVIDEALDIVQEAQVSLDDLRRTFGAIPEFIRERHTEETRAIADVVAMLEEKTASGHGREAVLPRYASDDGQDMDFTGLRKALRDVRFDHQSKRSDTAENRAFRIQHDEVLQSLQSILENWMYYAKVPSKGHTLNTARLVVPDGVKGAVVLDATASTNVGYSLFDKALVISAPTQVRSYKNVTLHVSRGHNVGKLCLRKHPENLLRPVMDDLNVRLAGRNVLFVTHNDVKAKVYAEETKFDMRVGHWGAIDGSNEWMDCDSVVIFGLRSRPSTWTANTYFALQGVKDTDWLQSKERPFGKHSDIRSALRTGQTITEVIQAINRIRCRRVIDDQGNCPAADIYILLPDGSLGDTILKGITDAMAGIAVKDWHLKGTTKKTTKKGRPKGSSRTHLSLLEHLKGMMPGSLSKSALMAETKVSKSAIKRFIAEVKDATTEVAKTLESYGITFRNDGFGRNAKSYFYR